MTFTPAFVATEMVDNVISKIEIWIEDGNAYISLSGKSCSAASRRSSNAKWYSLRAIKISALPRNAKGNDRPWSTVLFLPETDIVDVIWENIVTRSRRLLPSRARTIYRHKANEAIKMQRPFDWLMYVVKTGWTRFKYLFHLLCDSGAMSERSVRRHIF